MVNKNPELSNPAPKPASCPYLESQHDGAPHTAGLNRPCIVPEFNSLYIVCGHTLAPVFVSL